MNTAEKSAKEAAQARKLTVFAIILTILIVSMLGLLAMVMDTATPLKLIFLGKVALFGLLVTSIWMCFEIKKRFVNNG